MNAVDSVQHGADADAVHYRNDLPDISLQQLVRGCQRVVVAPHPDDETLGVGGLLSVLIGSGFPLEVIAVTDGEASHNTRRGPSPDVMRSVRTLESALALRRLGWARPRIRRLRLPDSAVTTYESELRQRLGTLLRAGDRVFTTWEHDGHADHEATARAVLGVAAGKRCVCAQFPVWSRAALLCDQDGPIRPRMCRFALDAAALRRKSRALQTYRSQLVSGSSRDAEAVLSAAMVEQFLVPFEVLVL